MSVQDWILKIKRRDNRFFALLYSLAKGVLTFRVPVIRPIHSLLYYERSARSASWGIFKKVFYYEPMLRARCERVGEHLVLNEGIPCIEGNLKIYLGDHVTVHGITSLTGAPILSEPVLEVGNDTYLGYAVVINVAERVQIGDHCYVAAHCWIADYDGHPLDPERRRRKEPLTPEDIRPVILEDDVWLGTKVTVLKGVTIGRGSVVGSGSVVTRDIPPYSVAGGNPARVIKSLKPENCQSSVTDKKDVSKSEEGVH